MIPIPGKVAEIPEDLIKYVAEDLHLYAKDIAKAAPHNKVISDCVHDLHLTAKFLMELLS